MPRPRPFPPGGPSVAWVFATSVDRIWAQEFSGASSPINLTWPTDFPVSYQSTNHLLLEYAGVQITTSATAGNRRSRIDLNDFSIAAPFALSWISLVSGGLQIQSVTDKRYQWGVGQAFDTPSHGPVNHECLPGNFIMYSFSFAVNKAKLVFSIDNVQAGDTLKVAVQFLVLPVPL